MSQKETLKQIHLALIAAQVHNLRMIPGVENLSKHASFDGAEQRRLFDVLCSRYMPPIAA